MGSVDWQLAGQEALGSNHAHTPQEKGAKEAVWETQLGFHLFPPATSSGGVGGWRSSPWPAFFGRECEKNSRAREEEEARGQEMGEWGWEPLQDGI